MKLVNSKNMVRGISLVIAVMSLTGSVAHAACTFRLSAGKYLVKVDGEDEVAVKQAELSSAKYQNCTEAPPSALGQVDKPKVCEEGANGEKLNAGGKIPSRNGGAGSSSAEGS